MTMPWEPAPGDPNRVVPSAEATEVFENIVADAPIAAEENPGDEDPADEGSAETDPVEGTPSTGVPTAAEPSSDASSSSASAEPSGSASAEATVRTADTDLCAG